MAGSVSGVATTYGLPNYTGPLIQLTPADTPVLSAIGGLNGGGEATESTEFEWETFDLRAASQPEVLEGADAPTATARVRGNVTNVVQIHHEAVSVSYTKLAATQLKSGSNNAERNPVGNELDWQVAQRLKEIGRDLEFSLINGVYQKPSDNATGRKTRGLLAAISTNAFDYRGAAVSSSVTATAATNKIGKASHGLSNGDVVVVTAKTNGAGIVLNQPYYVVNKGTDDFEISLTKGGSAVDITSDGSGLTYRKLTALTMQHIGDAMQAAWDNGGISESAVAVIMVNSNLKRAITDVFASAYGKFSETSRTVGGVAVDTIETDFGRLGVMLDRHMPRDTFAVVSFDQLNLRWLNVPGKGAGLFAEPLAKTGAADRVQLYGEVGLQYGNEASHAKAVGLALG